MSKKDTLGMPSHENLPSHLAGNFAPVMEECTSLDLPVQGQIPASLRGSYVRNGPNPQSGTSNHWFAGDGMLHGIQLEGGRAKAYRNRWVRTKTFAEPETSFIGEDFAVDRSIAVANTNIVQHAGRWLALVETSFPTEVTSALETVGTHDFAGKLQSGMTAHPKFCPKTGEMHFFGYGFLPPLLSYHRVDAKGVLVQTEEIDVTGPTMMHDFAITENYVVFMDLPVVFDFEQAMGVTENEGGFPYHWSDDYPARLGVMPRNQPGAPVRWFAIDPCYSFHPFNAFERDGEIILDLCRYPELWRESSSVFQIPSPHRFTLNLKAGTASESPLADGFAEFPRIDDRRTGLPHRFGYAARSNALPTDEHTPPAILKYDLEKGTEERWDAPPECVPGEALFVADSETAGEDEGWLLFYAYDENRDTSDLIILNAQEPAKGPVARITLPQRVPFGFHGNWFPDQA